MDILLTIDEAAGLLRKSQETIDRWVKDGLFPVVHLSGGDVAIRKSAVARFIFSIDTPRQCLEKFLETEAGQRASQIVIL